MMPYVSVILPLYNGIKYIRESLESVIQQTYTNWELIVVNEYGSDDGSAEVVLEYAKRDSRIRLVQNSECLGLAESLNVGIGIAKGVYIARVDVDDPSYPLRFEKQVKYLEEHKEVALCGTLQRSVLPNRSYIEEVPCNAEELKAALLFGCEISHCSVMFRKEIFIENGWKYDGTKQGEDYDLWTRIMFQTKLVNIPEVLVDHRWGFDNISLSKGEKLRQEVRMISARTLENNFNIYVEPEDCILLSGWRNCPEQYAKENVSYFIGKAYRLLMDIRSKNLEYGLIEKEAFDKILFKRWNWVCKSCGIFFAELPYENMCYREVLNPQISIILPLYHGVNTLRETIDSIRNQEFTEWELLIICEAENKDGSTELAKIYEYYDKRIKVVQNQEKLGLAGSLNKGIKLAKAEYIARIDADDLMNSKRLVTQFTYMEKHKDVGVTQFYQHYFGKSDFIHMPPISAEDLKAKLLFFCDACHSTVMIRKNILKSYNLWYQEESVFEDYDLWTRLINVTKFETIPEVYGEYRVGNSNISVAKSELIQKEMCDIISKQLKNNLGINIEEKDLYLLNGWENIFLNLNEVEKDESLGRLRELLLLIWEKNQKIKFYDSKSLLGVICAKWRWSKYNESWHEMKKVTNIETALEISGKLERTKKKLKSIIKIPLSILQSIKLHIDGKTIEHMSNVVKDVNCDYYNRLNNENVLLREKIIKLEKEVYKLAQQNQEVLNKLTMGECAKEYVEYTPNEKIRIVFLFQIASFWPAWESFYFSCINDSRLEVKLLFLDETNTEQSQMLTAKSFLDSQRLEYIQYDEFELESFNPHIMVIQTPYDRWHRQENHWARNYRKKGYRIVYIPYGIEISDTEESHRLHFEEEFFEHCWKIYTFSDVMQRDYKKYCNNAKAVVATGLPRFDYYTLRDKQLKLENSILNRIDGRKVVLWKVHFSKIIWENGNKYMVTPEISEYVEFSKKIMQYKNLFFIFMPHPKFFEEKLNFENKKGIQDIMNNLSECNNVWIDRNDDYRNLLMLADYIIVDRSAIMVESAAINRPILYMFNESYFEPVTDAIKPLIDSYYQGSTCEDMIKFIDNCNEGFDPNYVAREKAFKKCFPMQDGFVGNKVKEDIINDIIKSEKKLFES